MIQLAQHFRSDLSDRHSEWLRQRQWFIKAKVDQEKREDAAEKAEADFAAFAAEIIVATDIQLRKFQTRLAQFEVKLDNYDAKLDVYDEAVTRALIEQLERMDVLKAAHSEILDNAYVLENGRRVFKSEDGTFVVDEFGANVEEDIVDPETIPAGYSSADVLLKSLSNLDEVQSEIDALHQAQSEIDVARERSSNARDLLKQGKVLAETEGVTVGALNENESELDAAVPKSLSRLPVSALKLISGTESATAPAVEKSFASASKPIASSTIVNPERVPNAFELGG
jgi:hypothetical protein